MELCSWQEGTVESYIKLSYRDGAKLFALFYKRKGVIIMTDFEMLSIFMMRLSLVTTLVMIKKDK